MTKEEKILLLELVQETIWGSVGDIIGNQMNKIGNIYENPELLDI